MEYEDQLIREATEGPTWQEVHEDYCLEEATPETTIPGIEMTLESLASKCETASQFIYKVQRDAIERDAPYNEGTFLGALMQWAESTPANQRRFKLSGWFGIANDYWDENHASNLNKADANTATRETQ